MGMFSVRPRCSNSGISSGTRSTSKVYARWIRDTAHRRDRCAGISVSNLDLAVLLEAPNLSRAHGEAEPGRFRELVLEPMSQLVCLSSSTHRVQHLTCPWKAYTSRFRMISTELVSSSLENHAEKIRARNDLLVLRTCRLHSFCHLRQQLIGASRNSPAYISWADRFFL